LDRRPEIFLLCLSIFRRSPDFIISVNTTIIISSSGAGAATSEMQQAAKAAAAAAMAPYVALFPAIVHSFHNWCAFV